MNRAFYLPPSEWTDQPLISGPQSQHAHALRLKAGDEAQLLDGEGKIASCKIVHCGKKNIQLQIMAETFSPEPDSRAVMAIALSKAARRGFFLEKAAELGASAIWLWQAQRSQGQISQSVLESSRARLIAGAKQSLNPWLPKLLSFDSVSALASAAEICDWKYVPFENEYPQNMLLPRQLGKKGSSVYVIGPEGGIEPGELDTLLQNGFKPVSLGKRVLRCETAATLCLGLHWWASQLPRQGDGDFAR